MNNNLAIKAENISKQYRLGEVGTGTITHDLNRAWAKLRGKEDPYLKIGESNDRSTKGGSDYVWSLKDINFEIEKGDAVGIIGRNGAGKSTLLKLLSRVTKPTTGHFEVNGRIASLLEVGTGFNPEMTGRENIFLNGAILGMRRQEIKRKFDEIVDFAGVERYIDTPVKRYSSGMYVRLAFAVAAHLESEILIVDEVLAVGDAEFQKKCLGKMGDVTKGEGRTVLFVSHNMAAVQNLCNKGIFLEYGKVIAESDIDDITNKYLENYKPKTEKLCVIKEREGNGKIQFRDLVIEAKNTDSGNVESFADFKIIVRLDQEIDFNVLNVKLDIGINNNQGLRVAWLSTINANYQKLGRTSEVCFTIENNPLFPGNYSLNLHLVVNNEVCDWLKEVSPFTVVEKDYYNTGKLVPANQGNILLKYSI